MARYVLTVTQRHEKGAVAVNQYEADGPAGLGEKVQEWLDALAPGVTTNVEVSLVEEASIVVTPVAQGGNGA